MAEVRVKGVVTETITVRREVEVGFDDRFDFDIDIAVRDAAYKTPAVPHDGEWEVVQSEGVSIEWKKVKNG